MSPGTGATGGRLLERVLSVRLRRRCLKAKAMRREMLEPIESRPTRLKTKCDPGRTLIWSPTLDPTVRLQELGPQELGEDGRRSRVL